MAEPTRAQEGSFKLILQHPLVSILLLVIGYLSSQMVDRFTSTDTAQAGAQKEIERKLDRLLSQFTGDIGTLKTNIGVINTQMTSFSESLQLVRTDLYSTSERNNKDLQRQIDATNAELQRVGSAQQQIRERVSKLESKH